MFAPLPHTRRRLVIGIDASLGGPILVMDADTGEVESIDQLTANPMQLILLVATKLPKLVVIEHGEMAGQVIEVMQATKTPHVGGRARQPAAMRKLLRPA